MKLTRGQLTVTGAPLGKLATQLSRQFGRPVLDHTGLKGYFDLTLTWQPESQVQISKAQTRTDLSNVGSSESSIRTALQEQLGLNLESQTAPVDFITIQHIEKPLEH